MLCLIDVTIKLRHIDYAHYSHMTIKLIYSIQREMVVLDLYNNH